MRTRWFVPLGAVVLLVPSLSARGQSAYSGTYSFKNEPLASVNQSYLGYSNFVYQGPRAPSPYPYPYGYPTAPAPAAVQPRTYVAAPAPTTYVAAPPRRFGLFGRLRGHRY